MKVAFLAFEPQLQTEPPTPPLVCFNISIRFIKTLFKGSAEYSM